MCGIVDDSATPSGDELPTRPSLLGGCLAFDAEHFDQFDFEADHQSAVPVHQASGRAPQLSVSSR
jgi:hypothetical protein